MSPSSVRLQGQVAGSDLITDYGFMCCHPQRSRCAHDLESAITLVITMSQWNLVGQHVKELLIINAELHVGVNCTLYTNCSDAGVMPLPKDRNKPMDCAGLHCFELFSGAFSGWNHVLTTLQRMGHSITNLCSVDWDADCQEAFVKTHGVTLAFGPQNFNANDDSLNEPIHVQANVVDPAWYHLLGMHRFDFAVISPPCPPWSCMNQGGGLFKKDGKFLPIAWALIALVRPAVVIMEMVSNIVNHEHWHIIRAFIVSLGYHVKWCECMELAQLLPQRRDRLILVAIDQRVDHLSSHRCAKWLINDGPTLLNRQILMPLQHPWDDETKVTDEMLQMYLDPNLMPTWTSGKNGSNKRTKADVLGYRLRSPNSVFGCILTTYGKAHLMDRRLLEAGGLLGTLLLESDGVRFLQLPEILALFAPTNATWLPADIALATRHLGNAISIPLAAIGIVNALGFLYEDQTMVEAVELFDRILQQRIHGGNMTCEMHLDGFLFRQADRGITPFHQPSPCINLERFAFIMDQKWSRFKWNLELTHEKP
eukprot:Skav210374  [mRNA]  locus=scaffold1357:763419:765032:- [translate_table: standard]